MSEHGLGPKATVFGDDDEDSFMPVAVLVGGIVYVAQGEQLVAMTHEVAGEVATLILKGIA